jgi:hypothetical protein
MEMSEEQLIDLWDIFANFVPKAQKEDAALGFIRWCEDNGVEEDVIYELGNADPYLEEAVKDLLGEETESYKPDSEYEDDGDEWSEYQDDEDEDWK